LLLKILSKIDDYIRIYIYIAIIAILVTASRIHTAKRLQRNLNINDYFKSAILFIFLPLGIFWIQNEIIGILKNEKSDNKNKGYTLIVVSVLLIIITIFNFKNAEFKTSSQNQNAKSFIIDSFLIEETRQQNDSFFYSMDDSSKADYIFKAGIQFCERGIYRAAINNFNYSIQFDSSKSDYYFNRGLILYQQFNQFDSAIIDLTRNDRTRPK
jgi:tetratricopeptide (TPR) repeat protein